MDRAPWRVVAAVLVLVFWGRGLVGAQTANTTQPDRAPGERLVARVQLVSTRRVGGDGAVAQMSLDLRQGESSTARVWVGGRGADGSCLSVVGAGERAPASADVAHTWEITVQLVSAEIDQVQLRVDWKRYSTDKEGQRVQVAGDVRTPSIAEQTPHLLDFVAVEDDACRLANVRLQIEAMMVVEAAAFAGRGIDYDLWLVYETADGQRDTRRRIVQGQHGQRTTFWFPTITWQRPGSDCTLSLTVRGELRGRLKPDGSVDLTVSPTTVLRLSDGSGAAEEGRGIGSRILSLTPGEVVEVQMPLGFGRATLGQCVPVEFADFFSGHSVAILMSAAAVESP